MDRRDITLICPNNDLESRTILAIAFKLGIDVRTSRQAWGAKLGREPADNLLHLKKNVIIVEMPDPKKEKELSQSGHRLFIIDHHRYQHRGIVLDRGSPTSSLEQFAELMDYQLTLDERWIAMNDKSYIWELLYEKGITADEIIRLRRQDIQAQGYTPQEWEQATEEIKKCIPLNEFILLFTEMTKTSLLADLIQLDGLDKTIEELHEKPEQCIKPKNLLIVRMNEKSLPVGLGFWGEFRYLEKLANTIEEQAIPYRSWSGHHKDLACFWGAELAEGKPVPQLTDRVLSLFLGNDWPLLKYSTVFFFPFKIKSSSCSIDASIWKNKPTEFSKKENYQEYIYFHSYVSKFLFNSRTSSHDAIKYYEPANLCGQCACLTIEMEKEKQGIKTLQFPVNHLAIHCFNNDIAILAIQISDQCKTPFGDNPFLWQILQHDSAGYTSAKKALLFNKLARVIYWSFKEQRAEGQIPKHVKLCLNPNQTICHEFKDTDSELDEKSLQPKNISTIVSRLVDGFAGAGNYEPLLDDRLVVYSFINFAGNNSAHQEEDGYQQLFSRFLYVDEPGTGYAYEKDFVQELMQPVLYKRWAHLGTLFGATRYSSIFAGFGGYFGQIIYRHFNSMYYQMALLALYYRVSLIDYSREIARLAQDGKNFQKLRQKLLKFTNIYWFDEVTNQDQGIEMFNIYKKAYRFDALYAEIKDEIERTDEVDDIKFQQKMTRGGLWFVILALFYGIMGMNFSILTDQWGKQDWLFYLIVLLSILYVIGGLFFIKKRR